MIKSLLLSLFVVALFCGTATAQKKSKPANRKSNPPPAAKVPAYRPDTTTIAPQPDSIIAWDAANRQGFMGSCVESSKMGKEKGTAFCACMLEKIMALYPNAADATGMTKEKTTELAKECYAETRKGDSTWSAAERSSFLKECSGKAIKNLGAAKTKTYCNCMLGQIEKAYPNPLDASKMTKEELDAWAKACGGL